MDRSPFVLFAIVASLAAQDPFGVATPAPSGVLPGLAVGAPFMGNAAFAYRLTRGPAGGDAAVLISLAPATLTFGALAVNVDINPQNVVVLLQGGLVGTTATDAEVTFPIPLTFPVTPSLAGLRTYAQGFVADPAAPGVLGATLGVNVELTMPAAIYAAGSAPAAADPFALVDPQSGALVVVSATSLVDLPSGAQFIEGGQAVLGSSVNSRLVARGTINGASVAWTPLFSSANPCLGVGYDPTFRLAYTLTGPTASTRELVVVDANPASPTHGAVLGSTTGLAGAFTVERWSMSRSGKLAAVPALYGGGNPLRIVDTDPTSGTFLQVVASAPMPSLVGTLPTGDDAGFSVNDAWVFVLVGNATSTQAVGIFDRATSSWVDHAPAVAGIQHATLPGNNPKRMAVARDGRFLVVVGGSAGSGFAARMDFDVTQPGQVSWTPYPLARIVADGATSVDVSPDGDRIAVGTTTGHVVIADVTSGALVHDVAAMGSGVTILRWM